MDHRPDVPLAVVIRIGSVCLSLPDAYKEDAWIGTRWCVRKRTFAHVLTIHAGHPPAYARAADTDGPACILTFQSSGPELERMREHGHPYFAPVWRPDIIGMRVDADTDWDEVSELLIESYCTLAPKSLVRRVARPPDPAR